MTLLDEPGLIVLSNHVRHVATAQGSKFYGLPIGSPITAALEAAIKAEKATQGIKAPDDSQALSDAPVSTADLNKYKAKGFQVSDLGINKHLDPQSVTADTLAAMNPGASLHIVYNDGTHRVGTKNPDGSWAFQGFQASVSQDAFVFAMGATDTVVVTNEGTPAPAAAKAPKVGDDIESAEHLAKIPDGHTVQHKVTKAIYKKQGDSLQSTTGGYNKKVSSLNKVFKQKNLKYHGTGDASGTDTNDLEGPAHEPGTVLTHDQVGALKAGHQSKYTGTGSVYTANGDGTHTSDTGALIDHDSFANAANAGKMTYVGKKPEEQSDGQQGTGADQPGNGNAGAGGQGTVPEGVGSAGHDAGSGHPDGDEAGLELKFGGDATVKQVVPQSDAIKALAAAGKPTPEMYELDPATSAGVFHSAIQALKDHNTHASSVYVYPEDEYKQMRLFLTKDGTAGFALHGDDVVSVFSHPGEDGKGQGFGRAIIQTAVDSGGKRLDAFDTMLPSLYAKSGFVAVARTKWDDSQAPEGWNADDFKQYNGGKPDVVFMALAKNGKGHYSPGDGVTIQNYDDGAKVQEEFLKSGAIKAPKTHPLAKEPAYPGVGESITSLDQITALPVGADVEIHDSSANMSYDYHKDDEDSWSTEDTDGIEDSMWSSTVGPDAGAHMSAVVTGLPKTDAEKAAANAATAAKSAATKQANKDAADAAAAKQAKDEADAAAAEALEKTKVDANAIHDYSIGSVVSVHATSGKVTNYKKNTHNTWYEVKPDGSDGQLNFINAELELEAAQGHVYEVSKASPNDLYQGQAPVAPVQPIESDTTSPSIALDPSGKLFSKDDIAKALAALQGASGFQVAYGLKKAGENPINTPDNIHGLTQAAQSAYPGTPAKPAVIAYLKSKLGIEEAAAPDDGPTIHVGSASPKSTGVQGLDGGDFTKGQIESAIKILQEHKGKIFKSELTKKGSPLGSLNPVSMIDAEKDKEANKQKFIALLQKALDDHNAKQPVEDDDSADASVSINLNDMEAMAPGDSIWEKVADQDPTEYVKQDDGTWVVAGSPDTVGVPTQEWASEVNNGWLYTTPTTLKKSFDADSSTPKVGDAVTVDSLKTLPIGAGITQNFADQPGSLATSFDHAGPNLWINQIDSGDTWDDEGLGNLVKHKGSVTTITKLPGDSATPEPQKAFPVPAAGDKVDSATINGATIGSVFGYHGNSYKKISDTEVQNIDTGSKNDLLTLEKVADSNGTVPVTWVSGDVKPLDSDGFTQSDSTETSVSSGMMQVPKPYAIVPIDADTLSSLHSGDKITYGLPGSDLNSPDGWITKQPTGEWTSDSTGSTINLSQFNPDALHHVVLPTGGDTQYIAPMDLAHPVDGMKVYRQGPASSGKFLPYTYNASKVMWMDDSNPTENAYAITPSGMLTNAKGGTALWADPNADSSVSTPAAPVLFTAADLTETINNPSGLQGDAKPKFGTVVSVYSDDDGSHTQYKLVQGPNGYKWENISGTDKGKSSLGMAIATSQGKVTLISKPSTTTKVEETAPGDLPPQKDFTANGPVHAQDLQFLKAGDLIKGTDDTKVILAKQNNGLFVNPDTGTVYAPPFVADMVGTHGVFVGHDDNKIFDKAYTGPDYVHEAQANLNTGATKADADAYTGDNAMAADVGTVLISTDGAFYVKSDANTWMRYKDGKNVGVLSNTAGGGLYKAVDAHTIQPYVKAGEPTSKYKIVPGKYSTGKGAAYMVVGADGKGVYVNSSGNVKNMTVEAVKKNYDAGMTNYGGMPDVMPAATEKEKVTKPKTVQDVPDGTYYNGNPNGDKTWVYTVDGDKVTITKPLPIKVGGQEVGSYVSPEWIEHASTGASFKHPYAGQTYQIYVGYGNGDNGSYYKNVPIDGPTHTFMKQADGTWKDGNGKVTDLGPYFQSSDSGVTFNAYNHVITSHGIADPVVIDKKKANTLFAQGKLLDGYGNSIDPDGYDGTMTVLGWEAPVASYLQVKKNLDALQPGEAGASAFKNAGVNVVTKVTKAYVASKGVDWDADVASGGTARWKVLSDLIGEKTDGIVIPTDTSNDATKLFHYDIQGKPVYPASLVGLPVNNASDQNAFIKKAADEFDGTIGNFPQWMDTYTKGSWISAFKSGDFASLYNLDVQAGATHQKSLPEGFKHPGYSDNASTNNIVWGPAVPGEKPAKEDIPGTWTKVNPYGGGLKPSIEEVQNYLIAAQMQHPTYLSAAEQRQWVAAHQQHKQAVVDQLSVTAENRKNSGIAELSQPLVWTWDIKVPKTYDSMFEGADKNPTDGWNTNAAKDYYDDFASKTPGLQDAFNNLDPNQYYYGDDKKTAAVVAYFQGIKDAIAAQALVPVYHKIPNQKVKASTHPIYDVEDQWGNKFFFKPAPGGDKYRSEAEHAGNKFGKLFGFSTTNSQLLTLDGEYGNLQSDVGGQTDLSKINFSSLTSMQIADIGMEHLLDHFLDNDDTKGDNAKVLDDGHIVGIDKGRAFKHYGAWKSLAADESMDSNAPTIYAKLYNAIRAGKFKKEDLDKAYLAVHKRAAKMQRVSDSTITELLAEGMKNRSVWDVKYKTHDGKVASGNLSGLTTAVLDRKNHIVDDFDSMWAKIYKDAGLGDLPEPPKIRLAEDKPSGLDDEALHDAVFKVSSVGKSTSIGSGDFHNGAATVWASYDDNDVPSFNGQATLMPGAQATILSWLEAHAPATSASKSDPSGLESHDVFGDGFITGAKTINTHASDGDYNAAKIEAFHNALDLVNKDLNAWSPTMLGNSDNDTAFLFPSGQKVAMTQVDQYKLMLDYYKDLAVKIEDAKSSQSKAGKIEKYQPLALGNPPAIWINKDSGQKITKLSNGDYIFNDGTSLTMLDHNGKTGIGDIDWNEPGWKAFNSASVGADGWQPLADQPKTQATNVKVSYGKTHDLEGHLVDGKLHYKSSKMSVGHPGSEYTVELPTGEKIWFRNGGHTGTVKSQVGRLGFQLSNVKNTDDSQASMQRVMDQLQIMGVRTDEATPETAERTYWRAMYQLLSRRTHKSGSQFAKAWTELQKKQKDLGFGTGYSPEFLEALSKSYPVTQDENDYWRALWSKYFDKDKVDKFIAEEGYLPHYDSMDWSHPEIGTGKPKFRRFDVTDADLIGKKMWLGSTNTTGGDSTLVKAVKSGGMLSTEERLRYYGQAIGGMSSFQQSGGGKNDQAQGSSDSIYTRIISDSSAGNSGDWSYIYNPRALLWTDTYSMTGDNYGAVADMKTSSPSSVDGALEYGSTFNETMVPSTSALMTDLEVIAFQDAGSRNDAIQYLKKQGINEIRGVPVEDRLVMSGNVANALKKVKEAWQKSLAAQ